MRFAHPVDDVLGTRAKAALLRVLTAAGGREFTGRELARRVGLDHKACNAALAELGRHGLVRSRPAGRAILWGLGTRHLVVETLLEPLFDGERRLFETLGREIDAELRHLKIRPVCIAVFGSVARGEETTDSDLDLLVVTDAPVEGEPAEAAADRLSAFISERCGMASQVFFETRRSLERKAAGRVGFVPSAVQEGRVIHGEDILRRLRRG